MGRQVRRPGRVRDLEVSSRALSYASKLDRLDEFAERVGDVVVENLDRADIFEKYDSEDTVFYCEPPYVGYEDYTPKSRGEQTTDRYDLLREGRARGPCRLLEAVRQCPVLTKSLMLMCTMLTT